MELKINNLQVENKWLINQLNLEKEQKDYYKTKLEERAESNSSETAVV